jgi:two-component system LytT family response regulator
MLHGSQTRKPVRVITIGDDPGLAHVCGWISADPSFQIIAEYGSHGALDRLSLDGMGDMIVLDSDDAHLVRTIARQDPASGPGPFIIVLATNPALAVEAYQVRAADFLVKPIRRERFRDALARVTELVHQRRERESRRDLVRLLDQVMSSNKGVDRLMVKSGGKIAFVKCSEIDWIEAEGDYVKLHSLGKKHLIREKISELEKQLPSPCFIRIHRSSIVNVERIKELQPLFYGDYAVILTDGTRLTLSRSYRERFFQRLTTTS